MESNPGRTDLDSGRMPKVKYQKCLGMHFSIYAKFGTFTVQSINEHAHMNFDQFEIKQGCFGVELRSDRFGLGSDGWGENIKNV